uniref:Uncharacterized protein n=1 Tax=Amorphochlora amoebiformis TaxID=1561963 RepID=A0A7S0DIS5_9EUKA|mmetsp:Transcript_27799/g.44215  ORF Transcript_27799/g.44215 Transcript_27799/m.44215 type:complete len:337 (+) Transcript_27799:1-1011(+)
MEKLVEAIHKLSQGIKTEYSSLKALAAEAGRIHASEPELSQRRMWAQIRKYLQIRCDASLRGYQCLAPLLTNTINHTQLIEIVWPIMKQFEIVRPIIHNFHDENHAQTGRPLEGIPKGASGSISSIPETNPIPTINNLIPDNLSIHNINNINNINDINNNINCNASLNHSHGPSVFKMRGNNVAISHLLLFLLSVHSICAGISFGAIKKVGTAVGLFIAIICHKGFAGFALGMSFRQNSIDVASASCAILMFSSMTPLGAMIGFVTCRIASGDTSLWFSVIFKGIAAGSFIYISLVEILLEEFNGEKKRASKISKLCGFFIGNLAMTVLGYYVCPG